MAPNKVYESIVKMLFNVVRNDELKYHIYKNEDYRKQFLGLINDLLTLELTKDTKYHDKQWATTFGKAIVVITGQKQRLEKNEKNVNEIYEDYSKFLTYTNKDFGIDDIAETMIIFSQEEILMDAKLSPQKIAHFEEKEAKLKEEQVEAEKRAKTKEENSSDQVSQEETGFKSTAENPYLNDIQSKMPIPPTSDPRFYPYSKKPKWMPWMRWIIGALSIALSIVLISFMIYGLTKNINFSKDNKAIGDWVLSSDTSSTLRSVNQSFRLDLTNQANSILSCILYGFVAMYLGYISFKKPNSVAEKYHISYVYFVVLLVTYLGTIGLFYRFIDLNSLKNLWLGFIKSNVESSSFDKAAFNEWWDWIVVNKSLHQFQNLAIASTAFGGILAIFSIVIMIIQPHVDRNKVAHATEEYQRAIASVMQGRSYEMDPALFDNDDKIIQRKSRFATWREKRLEKKKNKKDKNEE